MGYRLSDQDGNRYKMRPIEDKSFIEVTQDILMGSLIALVAVGIVLLVSVLI